MITRRRPWQRLARIADGLIVSALFVAMLLLLLANTFARLGP